MVETVTCDAEKGTFEEIILWAETSSPLTVKSISCAVRFETPCGDATHFTNVTAGTVVTCDYETSSCALSCDSNTPTHSQPNVDTITCDPARVSALFSEVKNPIYNPIHIIMNNDDLNLNFNFYTTILYNYVLS